MDGLPEYALTSALRDRRFSPVSLKARGAALRWREHSFGLSAPVKTARSVLLTQTPRKHAGSAGSGVHSVAAVLLRDGTGLGRLDGTFTRGVVFCLVHVFCRLTAVTLLVLQVGTHGLIINFVEPGAGMRRSATYLPEIAHREGWTKRYTVESLILKSGYNVRARLVSHRLLITDMSV